MAIQAQLLSENLGFYLGNSQDMFIENACGFDNLCFVPQQHQQQQQQQQHQQHQLIQFDQFQNSNNLQFQQSTAFSQSVSSHMERQRLEFEHFITLQNERLRRAMQEQRKQEIAVLMKKYEWKSELLVRQKEEEIAKAANRATELQGILKRMEIENLTWQRAVKENESMIASLNWSIQRLRENAAAGDAESCCQHTETETETETEKEREREKEKERERGVCKWCNTRNSCVVMLPCRHLCSCKDCEVFLDSCPVCTMPKKATIEALI